MKYNQMDESLQELFVLTGNTDRETAVAAQNQFAKAITTPLRQGVLVGDISTSIFDVMVMPPGTPVEFPLDLLAPGEEDEHVAYTMPHEGRVPERHVEGSYVTVPTYSIANSIDWKLKYAREANYFVAGRAMDVFRAGFVQKTNDDGWHTLLGAGADRGIVVYDADADAGQFTKRLVSLMSTVMRRNSGGNTASIRRGSLTDLYVSPESIEDVRNWGIDQVDEITRREIFVASQNGELIVRIFGVNLHPLDELGENQVYQTYYTSTLSGTLASADVELVVGLDLGSNDSFLMPIKEDLVVAEDPTFHRRQLASFYGWREQGFAVLDNRRVILGSY